MVFISIENGPIMSLNIARYKYSIKLTKTLDKLKKIKIKIKQNKF